MGANQIEGVILEKGEEYYTHLRPIFLALDNFQNNYNWFITDYECYPQEPKYAKMLSGNPCWLSGDKLTEMIEKEDFQWIWGVLSGFRKDITKAEVMNYTLPQSDGYTGFWEKPVSIQHPLAEIEIVPWDSSLVLFISKIKEHIQTFEKSFPLVVRLEDYIKSVK